MDNSKIEDINLKGSGSIGEDEEIENEMMIFSPYQKTKNVVDEWESIIYIRLSNKIHNIVSSGSLDKVPWKDELADMVRRIVPGKTFNLWEESLEKEYLQRPKRVKLLPFLGNLENTKLQIIYKSVRETKELEIRELDMIEFLDRDFLFLGNIEESSDVVKRPTDDCEWCCRSSISRPETNVSSIHHMLTVINNKIFYLEKFIWELDDYLQFTPNFDYSVSVFDIPSRK